MPAQEHQFISRIFALLDCFTVERPELGVREAARLLNISASSCGRLMADLKDEGVLTQNPDSKTYALAGRVLRWADVYGETSDLRKKAHPYMQAIYEQTNETISLYSAEKYDRVCVEQMESRRSVRIHEPVGNRISIFAGSGGKSILAYRDSEEIDDVIRFAAEQKNCSPYDESFRLLREELAEIRACGFAISHGEWQADASGIASPIFNERNVPIGSISISGPSQRFQDGGKLREYAGLLVKNVGEISRELGSTFYLRLKGN